MLGPSGVVPCLHTWSNSPLPIQHCQPHFTARLRCKRHHTCNLMLSRTANLLERMARGYLASMYHDTAHRAGLPMGTLPRSKPLCMLHVVLLTDLSVDLSVADVSCLCSCPCWPAVCAPCSVFVHLLHSLFVWGCAAPLLAAQCSDTESAVHRSGFIHALIELSQVAVHLRPQCRRDPSRGLRQHVAVLQFVPCCVPGMNAFAPGTT